MATSGAIKAGKAFVRLFVDDDAMQRGLKQAQARLSGFAARSRAVVEIGTKINQASNALIAKGTTIAAPILAGVGTLARYASRAEESTNRFNQVFGSQADAAGRFADQIASEVGRAAIELKDNLSAFQGFSLGLGFDPAEAREVSESLTRLGLDFASFNNLSDQDAFDRLLAAMSGSSEVLAKYGINTKEAAVAQEAMQRGWDPARLTEQQKALARLAIIQRELAKTGAVGDAARTADGYANVMKRLRAVAINVATAVGKTLLPTLTDAAARVAAAGQKAGEWIDRNREIVKAAALGALAVAGFGVAMIAVGLALKATAVGFLAVQLVAGTASLLFKTAAAAAGLFSAALGLISSPAVIAAAAVAGLGLAILGAAGTFAPLLQGWQDLRRIAGEAISAIAERLKAGDLAGAAKIGVAGLTAAWRTGLARVEEAFNTFRFNLASAATQVFFDVAGAAVDAVAGIRFAFASLKQWFAMFWADMESRGNESFRLIQYGAERASNAARAAADGDFDRDAADRQAEESFAADINASATRQRSATQEAEAANARDRDKIAADHTAAERNLASQEQQLVAAFAQLVVEAQTKGEEETARAVAEFKAEVTRINAGGGERGEDTDPADPADAIRSDFEDLLSRLSATVTGGTAKATAAADKTVGGFNPAAFDRLFNRKDSEAERTARATEESAKTLHRIAGRLPVSPVS